MPANHIAWHMQFSPLAGKRGRWSLREWMRSPEASLCLVPIPPHDRTLPVHTTGRHWKLFRVKHPLPLRIFQRTESDTCAGTGAQGRDWNTHTHTRRKEDSRPQNRFFVFTRGIRLGTCRQFVLAESGRSD